MYFALLPRGCDTQSVFIEQAGEQSEFDPETAELIRERSGTASEDDYYCLQTSVFGSICCVISENMGQITVGIVQTV